MPLFTLNSIYMPKYNVKTLTDTKKLANKIAGQLRGGEIIGLIGDLGAGKTTFTQYLAKALGVKQTVNSPTFNVIKEYKILNTKYKIQRFVHIDAYRLHSPQELAALGVEEYFNDKQTVTVIEWVDKVREILPARAVFLAFNLKPDGTRAIDVKK